MMEPIINKIFNKLMVFLRDIKHLMFTLYSKGEEIAAMELSPLTIFTGRFTTGAIALCKGTFQHISNISSQEIKDLFFSCSQVAVLSVKSILTDLNRIVK